MRADCCFFFFRQGVDVRSRPGDRILDVRTSGAEIRNGRILQRRARSLEEAFRPQPAGGALLRDPDGVCRCHPATSTAPCAREAPVAEQVCQSDLEARHEPEQQLQSSTVVDLLAANVGERPGRRRFKHPRGGRCSRPARRLGLSTAIPTL